MTEHIAEETDHHDRKVHCPNCRARLMDIHAKDLEYKAVLAQIGSRMTMDFSMKCPKCKSVVGISFERTEATLYFRMNYGIEPPKALAIPTPYRVILLALLILGGQIWVCDIAIPADNNYDNTAPPL